MLPYNRRWIVQSLDKRQSGLGCIAALKPEAKAKPKLTNCSLNKLYFHSTNPQSQPNLTANPKPASLAMAKTNPPTHQPSNHTTQPADQHAAILCFPCPLRKQWEARNPIREKGSHERGLTRGVLIGLSRSLSFWTYFWKDPLSVQKTHRVQPALVVLHGQGQRTRQPWP